MKYLRRTRVALAALGLGAVLVGGPATAHQTFLISDLYAMRPGTDNFLILRNGTYHDSGYSITRKMSRDISIVMGGNRREPGEGEVQDVDSNPTYKSTYIKVVADTEGTGLAGVAAHPDYIALPAEIFANYLKHDGIADTLEDFSKNSTLTTVRERYTKHAKALFQVGKKPSDDYKRALGYKVEVFVDRNPAEVKVGEEMPFHVLYEGKPLANQLVYVGRAKHPHNPKATVPENAVYALRTDGQGRAKFAVTAKDKWYIELINMQKVDEEDVDYESNWSTITFEVR